MHTTVTEDTKQVVHPRVRGFICTTAHKDGCAQHTEQWIKYVQSKEKISNGPKKVLVIGASTGFGLASRIAAAFGCNAQTIGVFFERPSEGNKTASPGWYNSAAFENEAQLAGLYAKSINGDAFSNEVKQQVVDLIKNDWDGQVDCVVYSIASPRRKHPESQEVHNSVLKPIGAPYTNKTVDVMTGKVSSITIEPANQSEIDNTVAVMGGEDWEMWMKLLAKHHLLAKNVITVAYTYIGPDLTFPIYRKGTIGAAKAHLEQTAHELDCWLQKDYDGHAYISVNKALVTQASAAIPVVPLYISLLYRVMKEKGLHEGCIEQMWRLFTDRLYRHDHAVPVDAEGRIRIDDWEMRSDVQNAVILNWDKVEKQPLEELADLTGYREDFYQLFGFDVEGVDYEVPINIHAKIPSIAE